MTLNISVPNETQELRPRITVVGVGGAGGNAVNNMINANLDGVDFIVANTDGQALATSLATRKMQLGRQQTQGLGAGSKPEIGRIAAEESIDDICAELADSHMVFITAGMGGGTGTGAAPVIARACRERGILTVGVITKPFDFEGQIRMEQANTGIAELQAYVDTLIVIPNQNLFRLANEKTTFADAFAMADQVLHQGVCGITNLMIKPGTINLDFADIRSVMAEMGKAMMGTGEASGDSRATNAAEAAINNPLLDETSMKGAQAVLINITGGSDMTLFEVDEAANHIRREIDADATIIFGSALDDRLDGIMRVSVVATGIDAAAVPQPVSQTPVSRTPVSQTPVSQTPVSQAPVSQAPVSQAPASQTPVSQAPPPMATVQPQTEVRASSIVKARPIVQPQREVRPQPEVRVQSASEPMDKTPFSTTADDDFALNPTPPIHEAGDDEGQATSDESYFSTDPNQHNLLDSTDDAAPKAETSIEGDKPFIPSETVEPLQAVSAEARPPESRQGGLIRHLSRVFSGRVDDKSEATTKPVEPVLSMAKVKPPNTEQASEGDGGDNVMPLARAKTPPPPQLDIGGEDIDLEIPAFLRRQAN